jgi:hypothetical protein
MNDITDPGLELGERMEPMDGFRMEYLGGEIVMMTTPNAFHNRGVELVRDALPSERFARRSTQAVAISGRTDRPDPDLTVTGPELADEFFTVCASEDVLLSA